jgi:hypothetical protein
MLHAACIDPMLCRRAYIFAENENGPDVKLGSKRQGRYRLLDWEKPEEAKARPKPTSDSLSFTVNRLSICRAWRRKRAEDHLASAPVRRLRCSEPCDGLDGFPPVLARTIELNEPRVPIGEFRFT